jgi:hypothetical protein
VHVTVHESAIVVMLETARSNRVGKLEILNPPVINGGVAHKIGSSGLVEFRLTPVTV